MKTIKQIKDILLIIAIVCFIFGGTILLFGEPMAGSVFDSFLGLVGMKIGAVATFVLVYFLYRMLSEETRNKIKDFNNKHFGH